METPQITPPQKMSLWDFKNKKNYVSKWERLLDFFVGLIFSFITFWLIVLLLPRVGASINKSHLFISALAQLVILVYGYIKRRWIFYGVLVSSLLIICLLYWLGILFSQNFQEID